jgi:choline dehydrogenase-like flavoprotein
MSRRLPSKDVVIIGLGWTGAIMAQELTEEGLEVLATVGGRGIGSVVKRRRKRQIAPRLASRLAEFKHEFGGR